MAVLKKIKKAYKMFREEGAARVFKWCKYLLRFRLRQLWFAFIYPYFRFIKKPAFFKWQDKNDRLFWHKYNATWLNERAVEIPIIREAIKDVHPENILEIGNVLSNYFPARHDILDKYDRASGVINEDIATFKPLKKYGLIVSISTLEHVGFDETPEEPEKILTALQNLKKNCLSENGKMIITFPIGYNPRLDAFLKENRLGQSKLTFLKKFSSNDWREINREEAQSARYGVPLPGVNVLVVAIYLGRHL